MKDKVKLYDIADDFRKPHGKNNFTLNHLAGRNRIVVTRTSNTGLLSP